MTDGLFTVTTKIPNHNQWGKQLISDISKAFLKVTTLIDDVNERYAAGNVEIKNSITEAKHEILTSVAAVEQVADAAKLQADTNAFQLKELQKKFDKLQREFCCQSKENKLYKMQSVKQELYSRRDNLVFTGISDHKEETNDQCKKILVRVLSETT